MLSQNLFLLHSIIVVASSAIGTRLSQLIYFNLCSAIPTYSKHSVAKNIFSLTVTSKHCHIIFFLPYLFIRFVALLQLQ
jgi:hypothetical protein